MEAIRAKLDALRYKPADWQLPVTEEWVTEFEREYGLRLPAEYRQFLLAFGGWSGSATCDFLEPLTPLGTGAWIDLFYGRMVPEYEVYDVRWATGSVGGAPDFVAVAAGGANGCMVVVRCGGRDDGHVYFFDRDQRALWADDEFTRMFPGLHPQIEAYLARRRAGQLPAKPDGYESLYLLARGFNEFVERLVPTDDE
ncbi:SMI1/KNR4 family protein [Gemmata sp. JC673]|uniref:SMI1/KNR4 family protein n=1 Tax=Gemmata algarum TaxID=2975278 RepID=A0ABU5EZS1_9BACT|nr:SMI1/KNR4 family protein [Gemmata algarum]MDY3560600.1 SMI1/KNR4 family protein [Gemmata algarum]